MSHLLNSPTLTGIPTAPTAAVDTNTTQIATTEFVINQAANSAPLMDGTAEIGSGTTFARNNHVHPTDTTRAPLDSPGLTGIPTAPTPVSGDNSTKIATTAFVKTGIALNPTQSLASYMNCGVLTGTTETWYPAGSRSCWNLGTQALVANRLYAFPIAIPRSMVLDRLAFNVTNANNSCRIGIYNTASFGQGTLLYPTSLVYDSGTISTSTTGVKNASVALSITLTQGLYWFVIVSNGTPTVNALAGTQAGMATMGYNQTLGGAGAQLGVYVAYTFAALPATFPSGATIFNTGSGSMPAIFARFSS